MFLIPRRCPEKKNLFRSKYFIFIVMAFIIVSTLSITIPSKQVATNSDIIVEYFFNNPITSLSFTSFLFMIDADDQQIFDLY